jgi:hypothetical protein
LDERHAIAIGKGLKLKQPVIIQLNDKNDVADATNSEGEGIPVPDLREDVEIRS